MNYTGRTRKRMNNRPEITAILSLSVQKHINPYDDPRIYWAREVTFDYATSKAVRVDFMKFKPVNNTVPRMKVFGERISTIIQDAMFTMEPRLKASR